MVSNINTLRLYTQEDILDYGAYLDANGKVLSYLVRAHEVPAVELLKAYLVQNTIKQSVRFFLKEINPPSIEVSISRNVVRATMETLFDTPFDDVPTLLSHEYYHVRKAAEWRLKRGI